MRVLIAFLPAVIITLVLFGLMQYLITSGHQPPVRAGYSGFFNLIHLKRDIAKQATPSTAASGPEPQQLSDDTPPSPLPVTAAAELPELPPLSVDMPELISLDPDAIPDLGSLDSFVASTDVADSHRSNPGTAALNEPRIGVPSPSATGDLKAGMHGIANNDVVALLRIEPVYPRKAARDGKQGWVKVGFTITERGTVIDAVVLDSRPRRIFNRSALTAIRKWRFKPKLVNGKPVPRQATQVIEFKLAAR